jgi:hypothetical protein
LGDAQEVPGTATLNVGGHAQVYSVSCASAGNCAAGGYYESNNGGQAFVSNETDGTWGDAEQIQATGELNALTTFIISVSCASAGDCVAGGEYTTDFSDQALVVAETNRTWGAAEEVPGTSSLNADGDARIESVSCASVGNCSAGGYYRDGSEAFQAFVVSETSGTWGDAEEVPGSATFNSGGAEVVSVSCSSAGDCAAGGYYESNNGEEVFVVNETNGTWGEAEEVPGTATLNAGGEASISSVSCASAGNCAAGGYYTDSSGDEQSFVVNETSGAWGHAEEVPGSAALNGGGLAGVNSQYRSVKPQACSLAMCPAMVGGSRSLTGGSRIWSRWGC